MTFAEWMRSLDTDERRSALAVSGFAGLLYMWFAYRARLELLALLRARAASLEEP